MSAALWMRPALPGTPRDELRAPLGRWIVLCRTCRGWIGEPKLQTGFARRSA